MMNESSNGQHTGQEAVQRARVVIADDHLLMAQGLAKLLIDDFDVVAVVNNATDLLAAAEAHDPHLVLTDVCMPRLTGVQAARKLRTIAPECKIVFISMYVQPEFVREAFSAGASGYLVKSSASTELREAIHEVMRGGVFVSSCIAQDVLATLLTPSPGKLSPREREVLAMVSEGCSAKDIAQRLQIAVKTAQFHRNNLMVKLGIHSTAELTKYALEHGITSY